MRIKEREDVSPHANRKHRRCNVFGTQAPCAASVMKGMTHYERNPRMHRRFMVVLMVLLFPALVYGGTTGKVTGMVKDKEAGTPLPGANVVLVGAPVMLGATSDADGRFILLNVPAGTYGLKCSFIGFQEVVVRNVQITPDLTTKVDFTLTSQTLELGQTLEVVATRPLIQRDQTASARLITSDEIENLPVRGYAGVTALQAGVTDMDGNLYVRGGRLEEVAYYVDGVSQQDLQTGTTRTSTNNKHGFFLSAGFMANSLSIPVMGFTVQLMYLSARILPKQPSLSPMHGRMSSSLPSLTLFGQSGSASNALPKAMKSAFPS